MNQLSTPPKKSNNQLLLWVILAGVFMFLILIGISKNDNSEVASDSSKNEVSTKTETTVEVEKDSATIARELAEKLEASNMAILSQLENVELSLNDLAATKSWDELSSMVAVPDKLSSLASTTSMYQYSDDKRVKALVTKLQRKQVETQKKVYPRLRASYVEFARQKLWENNITVTGSGSSITFVGGVFASNKNIKDVQEGISTNLHLFRFKRANYKWYKGADEYTYYTIDSANDSAI